MIQAMRAAPRVLRKKGDPLQLILFITSRCNLLCKHCFYADQLNKTKNELTLEEMEKLSRGMGNLLWFSMTGGEPFLRKDIAEIAEIFYKNNGYRVLTIVTNGMLGDQAVEAARQMSKACPKANIIIYVSIDGLENTHNALRMVPDGFRQSIETIHRLKGLKSTCPNLNVGTVTTICRQNQEELRELAYFLSDQVNPDHITINMLRGKPKDTPLGDIDVKYYKEFVDVQQQKKKDGSLKYFDLFGRRLLWQKERLQKEIIAEVAGKNRFVTPCYAGQISCVISEKGDVYPCEILDRKLGNIRDVDFDFSRIWRGDETQKARKFIRDTECFCTYECALTTNILFNPRHLFKMLMGNAA